ncbi:uncharacterized protein LOC123216938 isoform X3 [Mangifera indica]|uniref:uncharacterized protein LOC123216938 isoform X3 n=1 Tax=Mangifera indica TaxID=29780 RepID=UPI001CFB4AE2|nr:uncharacterized protein LOC123216938 isoform X3 [Mangifera indica]
MGWNYPEISLDEMMKLIKGFVDILILASGYQSSGFPAHWDAHNIKKAFQWALFFENVIRHLSSKDVYLDSFKELDATVNEMTANPSFPQGLSHLSCSTLSRARAFVSEYFIHALPLRDAHLSAFLRATVEMDLDELSKMVDDCFNMYLKKLMLLDSSLDLVLEPRGFVKDSYKSSSDVSPLKKIDKCTAGDFTSFAVQGLSKRQSALSCISTVKAGLDVLSTAVKHSSCTRPYNSFSEENLNQVRALALMGGEYDLVDFVTWNCWKSRNFLYFLDMRTVRLASGASMIFSAPKSQWVQVFEQLHISAEGSDDDFSEIIDTCILEYLIKLLSGQLHHLWKLPPVLVSVAIPLWSPLFGLYLSEIETHYKGDTLTMSRFCTCLKDGKEHKDCELAERIWLLYIFHICGSHLMSGASSA